MGGLSQKLTMLELLEESHSKIFVTERIGVQQNYVPLVRNCYLGTNCERD